MDIRKDLLDKIKSLPLQQKVTADHPDIRQGVFRFNHLALGQILIDQKKISPEQLEEALAKQEESGLKIGEILSSQPGINASAIQESLAYQFDLPYFDSLPYTEIDPTLVKNLNIGFCLQNLVLPISMDDFGVTVAVHDPLNLTAVDELRIYFGTNIFRVIVPQAVIESAINNVFERQDMSATELLSEEGEDDLEAFESSHDLLHDVDEAPVRKEVSSIIRRAISERASDIHIEPFEDRVVVRFRIDGRMREVRTIPKKFQSGVITRIKILSKLNIAESRLPQDGRISLRIGARDCDVRVSTLPIKFGERVVMRILDKSTGVWELDKMGLPDKVFKQFQSLIQQKHGIILVTGPTGSGKTTTLASAISSVNKPDVTIITVEDPVEVQMPGVSQVEVNEKAGLTFASALRSILRQNPNIILIGEIRDAETAIIAVQAAMTGHLVFSTLHTNDAASSVTRLGDFGIEPFQITTTVLGVLAVRLMRKICTNCREVHNYSEEQLALLGITLEQAAGKKLYKARPTGCPVCKGLGYQGRLGIYELLIFDDVIKSSILKSLDGNSLRKIALEHGMTTLRDSSAERFLAGETSLDEALYATQVESFE